MIEEVTTSASLHCNLVAAITVINTLNHHISSPTAIIMPEKWQLVSWQKKDEQASRIPKGWLLSSSAPPDSTNYIEVPRKCGLLNDQELEITEKYDATALALEISNRRLKSFDVVKAFCKVYYLSRKSTF
jgi:amidase